MCGIPVCLRPVGGRPYYIEELVAYTTEVGDKTPSMEKERMFRLLHDTSGVNEVLPAEVPSQASLPIGNDDDSTFSASIAT